MSADSPARLITDVHALLGEGPVRVARAFIGLMLARPHLTSASIGLSEEELRMQPNAGGLFMLDVQVSGVPEQPFAG